MPIKHHLPTVRNPTGRMAPPMFSYTEDRSDNFGMN